MNCPNCGMEIEENEKVCPLCGFCFEEDVPEINESDESTKKTISETDISLKSGKSKISKGIFGILFLMVIIIALAVLILLKFMNKNDSNNVNTIQSVTANHEETTGSKPVTTSSLLTSVTTSTVTTTVTTTTSQTTKAEATTEKGKHTEAEEPVSDEETFCTYNGGAEYPRIHAYVRQKGNEFNIRIKWGTGANSYAVYLAGGTLDAQNFWGGNMSLCTVEQTGIRVDYEISDDYDNTIRFYPENDMIMWNDIALTKESSDAEAVIGTVNINDGTLNVRESNSTGSEIIGTLDKNDVVQIIDELDGWYMILYNNTLGVVSADFIDVN